MNSKLIIIISSLLMLSSCLTIDENITINEDGSGKAKISLSFSELKDDIDRISSDQRDLNFALLRIKNDSIQKIEGISDVVMNTNSQSLDFSLSFNYDNITSLNNAMKVVWDCQKDYVIQKGKKVTVNPAVKEIISQIEASKHGDSILKETYYNLNITAPKLSGVKSEMKLQESGNKISSSQNLDELKNIPVTITFKFF